MASQFSTPFRKPINRCGARSSDRCSPLECAGTKHAPAAIPTSTSATRTNVAGSAGWMPKSSPPIKWPSPTAPATPNESPTIMSIIPSRKTIHNTALRSAPSAIRIPISWRRWFTKNPMTPPIPVAVMTNASPANKLNNVVVNRGEDSESERTCSRVRRLSSGWSGSIL